MLLLADFLFRFSTRSVVPYISQCKHASRIFVHPRTGHITVCFLVNYFYITTDFSRAGNSILVPVLIRL